MYAGGMEHRKIGPSSHLFRQTFVLCYDADTDAFTVHAMYRRPARIGAPQLAWDTMNVGRNRWLSLVSSFPAELRTRAMSVTKRAIAEPGEAWGIPIETEVARG